MDLDPYADDGGDYGAAEEYKTICIVDQDFLLGAR